MGDWCTSRLPAVETTHFRCPSPGFLGFFQKKTVPFMFDRKELTQLPALPPPPLPRSMRARAEMREMRFKRGARAQPAPQSDLKLQTINHRASGFRGGIDQLVDAKFANFCCGSIYGTVRNEHRGRYQPFRNDGRPRYRPPTGKLIRKNCAGKIPDVFRFFSLTGEFQTSGFSPTIVINP